MSDNSSTSFLNFKSSLSKVSFILIAIFVFIMILQISIALFAAFFNARSSLVKLTNGMNDATQMVYIPQDPSVNEAKTIYRSDNQDGGIEFTWSVWLFINDLGNPDNKYKHIFHKGNPDISENGLIYPNNSPGLYISPNTNQLTVYMNTYNKIKETIDIPNIPIKKWVNVIIRCSNKNMDIYINGTITKSITLSGIPKQNYGDVYSFMNGGFNGYVSNIWYYNYALGIANIQSLVKNGPSTVINNPNYKSSDPSYLSLKWFLSGNNDQYN